VLLTPRNRFGGFSRPGMSRETVLENFVAIADDVGAQTN